MKRLNKSVARKIYPAVDKHGTILCINSLSRYAEQRPLNDTMREVLSGLRIPKIPYQVTYVLDKKGPFRVGATSGGISRVGDCMYESGFAICFLPPHFCNKRVRREVRI